MNSKYIIILFLFIVSFKVIYGNKIGKEEFKRGLNFQSFEVDKDKRTQLNLTPNNQFHFSDGFSMQFNIKLISEEQTFGYVCRIIANDTTNIDLVSDLSSDKYLFSLVIGNKSLIQILQQDLIGFKADSWMKLVITIDPSKKLIKLKLNNIEKEATYASSQSEYYNIVFGTNYHSKFFTTDVAPMAIKDIYILNQNKKVIKYWKLDKHSGDIVYDELNQNKAISYNPIWLMDSHIKWEHKTHITLPYSYPQIAFDDITGNVFIVKGKNIVIYNVDSGQIDSIKAVKGEAFNTLANQLVYKADTRELISYTFENNTLARFNFLNKSWNNEDTQKILPYYWHHSKQFIQENNTLITVGGYGFHKYRGIIMNYSLNKGLWNYKNVSSIIAPRYLGSLGYLGNGELLYFGGYGSATGNQEEFPQNYYDLYKISMNTFEVTKLWDIKNIVEHFTNGNSLVINKEKRTFYTLSYPNGKYSTIIRLKEFSIDKPVFETVGDSIPYNFDDNKSYCDLLYYPKTSTLYAITVETNKNNMSNINVYSISYPPLQAKDVLQIYKEPFFIKWYYIPIGIVFCFIVLFFIVRKVKPHAQFLPGVEPSADLVYTLPPIEIKPSSINILGCFRIVDKEGEDITAYFTPTISQIFLLILLSTIKNGKGISSQELTDVLWYDKDSDSARNNRNVNISKLRLYLKKIGDVELLNNNNYWAINLGDNIFCDYKNAKILIEMVSKMEVFKPEIVNKLLNVTARGVLLPNFQTDWIDSYKAVYTNLVVDMLADLTHKKEVKSDLVLLFRIADVILSHDTIDEDAARLKTYVLFQLGKKGQAKQCYMKFVEDYKNLLGAEYKTSFNQFRDIEL